MLYDFWMRHFRPRRPKPRSGSAPLRCEPLERRDCPTTAITMNVVYGPMRQVMLSGMVTNDAAPIMGAAVTFTGALSGATQTFMDGRFSYTATANALGEVEATTAGSVGQGDVTTTVDLVSNNPTITSFTASHMSGCTWLLMGHVQDESAGGLVVYIGCLPATHISAVSVMTDGTFWAVVQLQEGESGVATAEVTDWWGLESNTAEANILA